MRCTRKRNSTRVPEGCEDFTVLIASELKTAGLLAADVAGMVSPHGSQRLTTDFGRQFVRLLRPPRLKLEASASVSMRDRADGGAGRYETVLPASPLKTSSPK
jgi:hypothetical protein